MILSIYCRYFLILKFNSTDELLNFELHSPQFTMFISVDEFQLNELLFYFVDLLIITR